MNTGIGDAISISPGNWRRSWPDARATTCSTTMRPSGSGSRAPKLVATTDRAFTFRDRPGAAGSVRAHTHCAHCHSGPAFKLGGRCDARVPHGFADGDQLSRRTPVAAPPEMCKAATGCPGSQADGSDNFAPLTASGLASPRLWRGQPANSSIGANSSVPSASRLSLDAPSTRRQELARDALYLLRPDTYVALVEASGAAEALDGYFKERGITPAALSYAIKALRRDRDRSVSAGSMICWPNRLPTSSTARTRCGRARQERIEARRCRRSTMEPGRAASP